MDDKKVSYELDSEYRVRVKDLPPETRPREKFISMDRKRFQMLSFLLF
jgi:hypothetical protein